ncbi:MAG: hypothetical protein ACK53L_34510, partial [Pirellulaceae bacterium]
MFNLDSMKPRPMDNRQHAKTSESGQLGDQGLFAGWVAVSIGVAGICWAGWRLAEGLESLFDHAVCATSPKATVILLIQSLIAPAPDVLASGVR